MREREQGTQKVARLTEAQKDALAGLVNGESSRDLAQRRSISAEAAETLRVAVRWKLGVRTDAEAVRIGLLVGLPAVRRDVKT